VIPGLPLKGVGRGEKERRKEREWKGREEKGGRDGRGNCAVVNFP